VENLDRRGGSKIFAVVPAEAECMRRGSRAKP